MDGGKGKGKGGAFPVGKGMGKGGGVHFDTAAVEAALQQQAMLQHQDEPSVQEQMLQHEVRQAREETELQNVLMQSMQSNYQTETAARSAEFERVQVRRLLTNLPTGHPSPSRCRSTSLLKRRPGLTRSTKGVQQRWRKRARRGSAWRCWRIQCR
jgi:hypothetical protein